MKDFNYITAQSLLNKTLNKIENTYSDILSTIISNINAKLISQTDSKSFDYTVSTRIIEKWWGIDLSRVDELTIIRFLCEYYHKRGFIVFSNNFRDNCQITICWGNFVYENERIKIS